MSKIANLAIAPTPQPPLSMSPQIPIPYSWSGDTACCFADRGKMHQELLILPKATFTKFCYCCRYWCCWLLWLEPSISLIWILQIFEVLFIKLREGSRYQIRRIFGKIQFDIWCNTLFSLSLISWYNDQCPNNTLSNEIHNSYIIFVYQNLANDIVSSCCWYTFS